jgi:hypothetical protein
MFTERSATSIKRRAIGLLRNLTFLALAVPIMTSTAMAQADSTIEGAWIFSIDAGPVSFVSLASFSAGGVFFGTGSLDRVNPVSTLTGSWKSIGRNQFGSTSYFFAFDPAGNKGWYAVLRSERVGLASIRRR